MCGHGDAHDGKNQGKGGKLKDIFARSELNNDARQQERSAIMTEMQSLLPLQGKVLVPKEDRVICIGV